MSPSLPAGVLGVTGFDRLAGGAEHLRRTIIAIENRLTPRDFLQRIAAEEADGDPSLALALNSGAVARDLRSAGTLQDFIAEDVAPGATFYRSGRPAAGRRLLIGFTGVAQRLMLPTPGFLQRMDARRWDVLMLRDSGRTHYRDGCSGLGADFPALVRRLHMMAEPYVSVTALGTSMGGFAAIRFALQSTRARGISVGGRRAGDVHRIFVENPAPPAFDALCACLDPQGPRARDLIYAHPADNVPDRDAARAARALSGGTVIGVAGVAHHALLAMLWLEGRLGQFLDTVLDPTIPPGGMAGLLNAAA